MLVFRCAGVAQLVELLICNQPVAGSSPVTSFPLNLYTAMLLGVSILPQASGFERFLSQNQALEPLIFLELQRN